MRSTMQVTFEYPFPPFSRDGLVCGLVDDLIDGVQFGGVPRTGTFFRYKLAQEPGGTDSYHW